MSTGLRLTVFGGGAIGLGFAASFAQAGHHVTVLARAKSAEPLSRKGISITGVLGMHAIAPGAIAIKDADHPDAASVNCDLLVLATKAYQVSDALQLIKRAATPGPRHILLIQNGWGSADEARAILPAGVGIFSSIVVTGIERRSASELNVMGHVGPVRIGSLFGHSSEEVASLIASSEAGFIPLVSEAHIKQAILNKFIFNTCLNATGALTGQTYGELVTNEHSRRLIVQLADEAVRVVAASCQYEAAASGLHFVEGLISQVVFPKAVAHRSSMLQDVEAGRRTEIDYLNGAVTKMGLAHGIETPFNDSILSLIRAGERNVA